MDKEKFRAIRSAVRDIADERAKDERRDTPTKRHYRQAFEHLRELNEKNKELAGHRIELYAARNDLKRKMGPERWAVYDRVSKRAWEEAQQIAIAELLEKVETFDDVGEIRALVQRSFEKAMDAADKMVLGDAEIKSAFAGEEELLDEVNRTGKEKLLPVFLDMVDEELEDKD